MLHATEAKNLTNSSTVVKETIRRIDCIIKGRAKAGYSYAEIQVPDIEHIYGPCVRILKKNCYKVNCYSVSKPNAIILVDWS